MARTGMLFLLPLLIATAVASGILFSLWTGP